MEIVFRLKTGKELRVKVVRGKAYKVTVELKSGHAGGDIQEDRTSDKHKIPV